MKIYKGLSSFDRFEVRTNITIGNFDGFHSGHRKLLDETCKNSNSDDHLTAITFDPMPEEFFKKKGFFRIISTEDKVKIFSESGFESLILITFDESFSKITAKDFIEKVLIKKLNINSLTVGSNFRFGHKRLGDINLLKTYAEDKKEAKNSDYGKFYLNITNLKKISAPNNSVVSSSHIRKLIINGRFRDANKLLKNQVSITGKVIHGEKRGRGLGYPTANINIYNFYPINGIFLVKVFVKDEQKRFGLASWGNKPTFSGSGNCLEVYIFDFSDDIYDEEIKIVFLDKLRDQIKFDSKEKLINQMDYDYQNALKIIRTTDEL